jgi:signal transduction histidine kinase
MPTVRRRLFERLSLSQRYLLGSCLVMACGMVGIGWWIGRQIEAGVVNETAATTALYIDSFIGPHLQDLGQAESIPPDDAQALSRLLKETPLGQRIVAFKVWDAGGRVLFSTNPAIVGRVYPASPGLARAWRGEIAARISDLQDEENATEREGWTRLLETYSPVRRSGTSQVIAVAEFYETVGELQGAIFAAQVRSWLVVGATVLAMYLLLAGIVQRGNDTIVRQQRALGGQVARLRQLLAENRALRERERRAAGRAVALNERFLRRVSGELHDGLAQDLALALVGLEGLAPGGAAGSDGREGLRRVEDTLRQALREVRSIAAGLRLPELEGLTPAETIVNAVRAHERRTNSRVEVSLNNLPAEAPLSVKISLFRIIQEALSNAYRHAGGAGQRVRAECEGNRLLLRVSDKGPGFQWPAEGDDEGHLGLSGMRERVESQGGRFCVDSAQGRGTTVTAGLPLQPAEVTDGL